FDSDQFWLPLVGSGPRDFQYVVAGEGDAGTAQISLVAVPRLQDPEQLLRQIAGFANHIGIEFAQRVRDTDILTRLSVEPELVDARADLGDEIGAPHQNACARTRHVLVRGADAKIHVAELERARLAEVADPGR